MQTLQPTLRLGRDVWDRAAMPVDEFRDRTERLQKAMTDAGLDALLLYGRGLNACGHPTYLANYIVKLPFAALVVLPREGAPVLMFEGATRGRDAAKSTTWIDDVRPCWNIAETCLTVLAERKLTAKTIGLAGLPRLVPFDEWRALLDGLEQATLVDAEALVDRQRALKSTREVAVIRRASRIVNLALARVETMETLRGATTESALAAEVVREARLAGAEDIRLMICRPRESDAAFRPPEDSAVAPGEVLFLHIAASTERYWAEAIRTFHAGSSIFESVAPEDMRRRFQALVGMFRPGTSVQDCVRAVRTGMTASEWQALDVCGGPGHGIGVTPEESPVLSESCDDTLAPGMCLTVRAALQHEDRIVLHGETIVL
ncbi:MAG TPA: M24 family metallopeptidase [Vicinamibacterales bacterium]